MTKLESVKVKIDDKFTTEKALRKFKRLCESFGIVREYKNRQNYSKPSVKQKEKKAAAAKRRAKNASGDSSKRSSKI